MKNHRLRLVLVGLMLPPLIWLAWPRGQEPDVSGSNNQTHANGKRPGFHVPGNGETDRRKRTRNLPLIPSNPRDQAALKRVENLIENRILDNHEVAEDLLLIAQDKRLSEEVRAEALEHGVLLDLPVFAGMAADSQIPPEMADTLLMHVINENQDEALQIRVYKDFLDHPSPEIHDEAMDMLRFVLGDHNEEKDEASLLRMVDVRLKELEK